MAFNNKGKSFSNKPGQFGKSSKRDFGIIQKGASQANKKFGAKTSSLQNKANDASYTVKGLGSFQLKQKGKQDGFVSNVSGPKSFKQSLTRQGQRNRADVQIGKSGTGDWYQKKNLPKRETEWKDSPAAKRFGPNSLPSSKSFTYKTKVARFQQQPQNTKIQSVSEVIEPEIQTILAPEEELGSVNLLTGRNPIREAIKTGRDLEKLMIAKGELTGSAREIVSMAKKAGVMIQSVERACLDQLAKNHQGMVAFASAYQYATVEEIIAAAQAKNEDPFIIVLDQITDPHNLGAVIRTAVCAGAHGVLIPQHRAVGLTPAAVKASSGAIEHIKVARVTNLNQTIKSLQKQGLWFYCASMKGEDYRKVSMTGPCALVIGSEGEGVSQLTASLCDKEISIPMAGKIGSLNASVAAAVLMYSVFNIRNPLQG